MTLSGQTQIKVVLASIVLKCAQARDREFWSRGFNLQQTGEYVAERWNELLDDPDVLVIDTRNHYKIDIGTFDNAVSPDMIIFVSFHSG